MSKTAITTTPNVIPVKPSPAPPFEPRIRKTAGPVRQAFQVIASLRVTVVLFVIGVVLVFLGTLAQMDEGIWTVVGKYFRSMLVWVPWQLFVRFGQVFFGVSPDAKVGGSFAFPGGWLIGSLLLINLLAAHAVRFRLAWRRSGILILHAGMVVMMLGELITGLYQVEARLSVEHGEAVNFVDINGEVELALTDSSATDTDTVSVVPGSILRKGGVIQADALPVDVEVDD